MTVNTYVQPNPIFSYVPPQNDFLDFYVSYLKELPECLSVVSMLASSTTKSSAFLEVPKNGSNMAGKDDANMG